MRRQWLALPALVALLACEPGERAIEAGSHPQSGTVQISRDGRFVYVLSEDHKAVFVHNRETRQNIHQIGVGDGPAAMALMDHGRLAVVNRLDGTVSIVNPETGVEENRFAVGTEPTSVTQRGDKLLVVLSAEDKLIELDPRSGELTRTIELSIGQPRGVAVLKSGEVYVTHFYAGRVSVVDLDLGVVTRDFSMNLPSNPLLFPNQLSTMTTSPDGDEVSVPHEESNNDPGNLENGGQNTCAYYAEGPSGMPAVVPAVGTVDARSHAATSDTTPPSFFACGQGSSSAASSNTDPNVANPSPALFNVYDRETFAESKMNTPVAVAYVDGGRGKLVVFKGTNNVLLMRSKVYGGQSAVLAEYQVGAGSNGIAVTPDGTKAFVWSQFDQSLFELDVQRVDEPTALESSLAAAGPDKSAKPAGTPLEKFPVKAARFDRLADDVLPANVLAGRRLFFDATSDKLTVKGAVSCQSCHPDGRSDGMRWTFGQTKIRNTPQLGGRISETAPFHWDGDRPEMSNMNQTVSDFMGGTGLESQEIEHLFAFIDTIPAARSPVVNKPALAESIARGAEIFFSDSAKCATCHTGAQFTDNKSWNVGTSDEEGGLRFGTPVLAGLSASAPYFHDGRADAATLEALVFNYVKTDKMGVGSNLNDQQLGDLVNFLKSL